MKSGLNPMKRRRFLKMGIKGGVIFAPLSLKKLLSHDIPISGQNVVTVCNQADESLRRLHKIAWNYGGELGHVRVENNAMGDYHGCL